VALTWIAIYLLCWVVLANAVAASSLPSATAMRERSLLTRWLLSRRLAAGEAAAHASDAPESQASGIDALLAASGAGRTLTMLADMRAITAMSPDERERLIATSPPLQALVADDALLAVLDDVHRLQLVDDACHGSFSAIHQLANDPAIAALGDDAALRSALSALDPDTLAAAIRACREAPGERVAWSVASAASSLQAAAVLKSIGAWRAASSERLAWPRGTACGLARARLSVGSGGVTLMLSSGGTVACWLDGREVALRRLPPAPGAGAEPESELAIAAPGDHAVIIMVTPPLWSLLAGPAPTPLGSLSCRAVVRGAGPRTQSSTAAGVKTPTGLR
jgi:hypothetical protein